MTWLHWTLMLVGALVAYGVVAYPLCRWLGRNSTTDPDTCRDKAPEFAGDAYAIRWAEGMRDLSTPVAAKPRAGPGHVTVFTHSKYINDPRRKWYGLGARRP